MSESAEAYHRAADSVEATNRRVERFIVIGGAALLAVAIVVIIWGAVSFGSAIQTVKDRQVQFHNDTTRSDAVLTCETQALDEILTELGAAQIAQSRHLPAPQFVFPKPC